MALSRRILRGISFYIFKHLGIGPEGAFMKLKMMAVAIATVASSFAFAKDGKGFLFTPYLHYEMGTLKATTVGSADASGTSTGIPVGAQIGYGWDKFWMAADVSMLMSGKGKGDAAGSVEADITRTAMGLDLGWKFGKFNLWLNYTASNSTKYSASGSDTTYTGTGYGLGMSYQIASKVAIDLGYQMTSFSKLENSGVSVDVSSVYSTYTPTAITLGVSFPLM